MINMNSLMSVTYVIYRGYSKQIHRNVKKPGRVFRKYTKTLTEQQLFPDFNEDNFDPNDDYDDLSRNESDFSTTGISYMEHLREVKRDKELLKLRIVARKYFKSTDPNFITWTEKEQIKSLHDKDSVEWTPERLSESFPALPETIKKILKSRYQPISVESVIKYDQGVIENWKKFKSGSLAVDPRLEKHLKKFTDRKIEIADLAVIAENFIKKSPVFPIPKCNLFTSIIKDYIEGPQEKKNDIQMKITDKNIENDEIMKNLSPAEKYKDKKHVTFDAFLENKIDKIANNSKLSLEDKLLVDEYKERKSMGAFNDENIDNTAIVSHTNANEPSSSALTSVQSEITMIKVPKIDISKGSMDTGILEWKKKQLSCPDDYPNYIKVPQAKAKSGVTFRVQDRYYDTDGEFLYRVPGLKT